MKSSPPWNSYPDIGSRFCLSLAAAAVILLSGCVGADQPVHPARSPTATTSVPAPSPGPLELPAEPTPLNGESAGPATPGGSAGNERWGAYGSLSAACEGVAGNVITLSLLPVSLNLDGSEEDLAGIENEVERIKKAAPAVLKADFSRVQMLVDSFADQLAAQPSNPEGKDQTPATAEGPEFDTDALNETLDSVRDWLTKNCGNR